jgi:hypothetical protein
VTIPWRALLSSGVAVELSGVTLRLAPRAAAAAAPHATPQAPDDAAVRAPRCTVLLQLRCGCCCKA